MLNPQSSNSQTHLPEVLWLNVSPALQRFDRPLLQALTQTHAVTRWDYSQDLDEPNCLEAALELLHDYLQQQPRPIHLIGHSTGGLLGLLYARRYPEWLQSLTLLSVGVQPTQDWHAHYYANSHCLRCSRQILLTQMVYNLFGSQSRAHTLALVKVLNQDLLTALSPHTLFRQPQLPPAGVSMPMLVCGGADDIILSPDVFYGWQRCWRAQHQDPQAKPKPNRVWLCPEGGYFFHYDYPERVSEQIHGFWQGLEQSSQARIKARANVPQVA
jgi:pimeloyl-ACP methyl ester carboxylesterase